MKEQLLEKFSQPEPKKIKDGKYKSKEEYLKKILEEYRKLTGYKGEIADISEFEEPNGLVRIEFNIRNNIKFENPEIGRIKIKTSIKINKEQD